MVASQQVEPVEVTIRPARVGERRFVEGTWSRTFVRRDNQRERGPKPRTEAGLDRAVDIGRRMDGVLLLAPLLERAHSRLVDEILAAADTEVAIACPIDIPDTTDNAVGWACWQGNTLHYVYVAPIARRSTIGSKLVLHSRCSKASHSTTDGVPLMKYLRRGA